MSDAIIAPARTIYDSNGDPEKFLFLYSLGGVHREISVSAESAPTVEDAKVIADGKAGVEKAGIAATAPAYPETADATVVGPVTL